MPHPLRLALVVLGLASVIFGVASAVTGLRGTAVNPPVITQVRAPADAHGLRIEEHLVREGSVSWLSIGAVVLGLTLIGFAARRPKPQP